MKIQGASMQGLMKERILFVSLPRYGDNAKVTVFSLVL